MTDVVSKAAPAELLKAYARLARENPVAVNTEAAQRLALAFAAYLDEVAEHPQLTDDDIRAEINAVMARNIVAVSLSFHAACVCFSCLGFDCEELGNKVAAEAEALHLRITRSAGMVH